MLALPRGVPRDAQFSPDGHLVLTLGWEGEARVHKASSGEVIWAARLDRPAENWSFSPDGLHLAALMGERLRLWDLHTGQMHESDLAPAPVLPFALGPRAGELTHAAALGYLTTLRIEDWHRNWVRLVGGGVLEHLSFDARGQGILGAGREGCKAWEFPSGRLLAQSEGHLPAALSGTALVTTRSAGWVEEVSLATRARRRMECGQAVVAMTADGATVISRADGLAYQEKGGQGGWEVRGHTGVRALAIAGGELVAAHADPYLRSWPQGRHEQLWGGTITCLAAGSTGLAVGTDLGLVRVGSCTVTVEGEVRALHQGTCGRLAVLSGADALSIWEGDRCLLRVPGCRALAGRGDRLLVAGTGGVEDFDLTTLVPRTLDANVRGEQIALGDQGAWWAAVGTAVRGVDVTLELDSPVCALAAGSASDWVAATEDGWLRFFEGPAEVTRQRLESPAVVLLWQDGTLWAGTREGYVHAFGPEPLGWLISFWDREWVAGTPDGWEASPRAGRHLGLWEEGLFVAFEEAPPELPGTARRLRRRLG